MPVRGNRVSTRGRRRLSNLAATPLAGGAATRKSLPTTFRAGSGWSIGQLVDGIGLIWVRGTPLLYEMDGDGSSYNLQRSATSETRPVPIQAAGRFRLKIAATRSGRLNFSLVEAVNTVVCRAIQEALPV